MKVFGCEYPLLSARRQATGEKVYRFAQTGSDPKSAAHFSHPLITIFRNHAWCCGLNQDMFSSFLVGPLRIVIATAMEFAVFAMAFWIGLRIGLKQK